MEPKEEKKYNSLFDMLYEAKEEVLKAFKKPILKARIKRNLQAAWWSGKEQLDIAEEALSKSRENLSTYDASKIAEAYAKVRACKQAMTDVEAEYKTLFNKTMKHDEDEEIEESNTLIAK